MATNLILVVAIVVVLFAMPALLRAWRIRRIQRRGWVDLRTFLIANQLDEAQFIELCKAQNVALRLKVAGERRFVHASIAAKITKAIREHDARNADQVERDVASGAIGSVIGGTITSVIGLMLAARQATTPSATEPVAIPSRPQVEWLELRRHLDPQQAYERVRDSTSDRIHISGFRIWFCDSGWFADDLIDAAIDLSARYHPRDRLQWSREMDVHLKRQMKKLHDSIRNADGLIILMREVPIEHSLALATFSELLSLCEDRRAPSNPTSRPRPDAHDLRETLNQHGYRVERVAATRLRIFHPETGRVFVIARPNTSYEVKRLLDLVLREEDR